MPLSVPFIFSTAVESFGMPAVALAVVVCKTVLVVSVVGLPLDDVEVIVVVPLLPDIVVVVVVPLPPDIAVEADVDAFVVDVDPLLAALVDWDDKDFVACPPLEDDDDDDDDDELVLAVSSLLSVDVGFGIVLSVRSARERLLVCKGSVRTAPTAVVIETQATQNIHVVVKLRLVIVPIVKRPRHRKNNN